METDPVHYDVVLIGAGIMSGTLAMMLKELEPEMTIAVYESLDKVAEESTDAWNNAGTGHSAFCELNYTPETPGGRIDISKAIKVADAFEMSREFWSYLVRKKYITDPSCFINSVPHMSCVWGEKNVDYLRRRHEALIAHPLFSKMVFSDDRKKIEKWVPLMMKGRQPGERVAVTYMPEGTDVNFGALTRAMFKELESRKSIELHIQHQVKNLKKITGGNWEVKIRDPHHKIVRVKASFVFIGAGGAALHLLEKSRIPEGKGFGGFPVSGQWLVCKNENVTAQHDKKVYGQAAIGAPPMSVPHLDRRIIAKKDHLLFGPYAGFTTKFLKTGSVWDLLKSLRPGNILPMLTAGFNNLTLTKYLVKQVTLSDEDRLQMLKTFVPTAKMEDWKLENAGQRVQVIKKDKSGKGVIEFGTELVSSADGSIAALLGASPGASVAASIMCGLLEKCFPEKMRTGSWKNKLAEMIPLYGMPEGGKASHYGRSRAESNIVLQLKEEIN